MRVMNDTTAGRLGPSGAAGIVILRRGSQGYVRFSRRLILRRRWISCISWRDGRYVPVARGSIR
jgi:hypothetical protein